MSNVQVNGVRIWYEEQGKGPAMLWAHGLGGTLHDWDETMDTFKKSYRVIAYDARGHGRSEIPDSPEAYSQDIMVQDMLGIMDALDISQAIVGGHSMGANVALNFGLKYPSRCIGLIPVGIGSGSTNRESYLEWHDKLVSLAEEKGMTAFLEEMKNLPAWRSALENPEIGGKISQTVLDNSPQAIAHTIKGVQEKRPTIFELGPRLEHLDVETLIVLGEADTPVIECSKFMAQTMPRATIEIIPAKSHWVHLERPQLFLEAVERFLSKLS
jgi:pimeloyl-ACP methyl ester carboxylesterase